MNNFGFGNFNNPSNENTLAQLFKPYLNQQSDNENILNSDSNNYSGIKVYIITKKDDLKYIKPDKTGQKQVILCEPEKEIYIARYNYATEKPDYEKYISEGNIELFKKSDNNAEMSQIAEALVAVVNKLEGMHAEIQELKKTEPKKEESNLERDENGRFVSKSTKKGK